MLTEMSLKRIFIGTIILFIGAVSLLMAQDVRLLPLRGPIATAKISPATGSSTAYKMVIRGQKAITFVNFSTVTVFISSASSIGLDGFPLITKGSFITYDLQDGTTVYFQGLTGGSDVRATVAR